MKEKIIKFLNTINEKELKISILIAGLVFVFFIFLNQWGVYQRDKYKKLMHTPLPNVKLSWENKIVSNQKIKIGLITDTHIESDRIDRINRMIDSPRVLGVKYLNIFRKFNDQMQQFHPDFIVHLGDIVEGTDDPSVVGEMEMNLVKREILKNKVPVYWVVGNHDLRTVSKEQFKNIFHLENLNYSEDRGDFRFIFLDGNFNPNNPENDFLGNSYIPGFLHPQIFSWLINELKTDKRVFVFMHQSAINNFDENGVEVKASIANARELRKILNKYNVEAIFNGHTEVLRYINEDEVEYYSLAGSKKNPDYPGAFYQISIEGEVTTIEMFYVDPETQENKIIYPKLIQ